MLSLHIASFIETARSGSFSKAAERLHISRPALIQQMNLLERDLGVTLLHRTSRGVTLTPAGTYFFEEAEALQQRAVAVMRRCRLIQDKTIFRIGVLPNFSSVLLPRICRALRKTHPEIDIQYVEVPLADYFKAFRQGQFDMMAEYMLGYHFDRTGTTTVKLVEDHHCCAIPREHPLSAHTSITLNDLRGQTLLLYRRGITRADDTLRDYLLEHGENITLLDIDDYKSSLPMKCEQHNAILIQYGLYRQSFATLSKASLVLPKRFPIDIGFCYRTHETMVLRSFLEVLEEYTEVFA